MIEVKHLSKKYGDHLAVDDLSFTVEDGQIYGFLGPNGAGKSTTMNMITGCLAATSGQVLVGGYDIFAQPKEAKKLIGYLPELPPLYPDMTPEEYLSFVAAAKGIPEKEVPKQVEFVMSETGLLEMRKRLIRNLSNGYRQRVGLAQAILGDPKLIILDEPTVGLDPRQIIEMRELILRLGKCRTVILSSHIMQEISAVCDHIMIITKGKLVATGTVDELSAQLAGSRLLNLTISGEESTIKNLLSSVEGVLSVTMTPSLSDIGAWDASLETAEDADLRQVVAQAIVSSGLGLLRLENKMVTLEDIFLELTEKQNRANEAKESIAEYADADIDEEKEAE